MATMKKRSLKASFVITFAGSSAALVAPGCLSDVTSNPPGISSSCPEASPVHGDPCADSALVCSYSDGCGSFDMVCGDDGRWTTNYSVSCNPPPPLYCPDTIPMHGDPTCFGEGTCDYMDECGLPVTASCEGTAWNVVYQGTCNPPPACDLLGTPEECTGGGACRWLTPGCGDPATTPALPEAGCYPLGDCVDDTSCAAGAACKQFMVTPSCVDEGCDACGQAVSLCL
jgi:hypothetical protein